MLCEILAGVQFELNERQGNGANDAIMHDITQSENSQVASCPRPIKSIRLTFIFVSRYSGPTPISLLLC